MAAALFSGGTAQSSLSNQVVLSSSSLNTSNAEVRPQYSQLQIAEQSLVLSSGDVKQIQVSAFDDVENKRVDVLSTNTAKLDCFVVDDDQFFIKILPNCQIAAIKPGRLRLQAQHTNVISQVVITSNVIDIEIISKRVNISAGDFNVQMEAWQKSLWVLLSGLKGQEFYLATLSNRTTLLPTSLSIELIPSTNSMEGMCRNNVPNNANRVACYFQAEGSEAKAIIHNNSNQLLDAQFQIQAKERKRQFSVAYVKDEAKPIYLDSPISEYVFANELGTNNTHFYRFNFAMQSAGKVRVTLSGYTHLIALNVSWGNYVCTDSMKTISRIETTCTIGEYNGGEVIVEIDGNNGVELMNAPAAVDGGTSYSLLIEQVI